ncbi:hypothetical protein AB4251_22340 [Vibrio lentus]|uniref:Cytosolic endo-beta-N-acetylglucosaminidase TIM barrel domain-containing protein n=1 Tax=Vibrio lentus TaxID=136468 RepID=A0AB36XJR5_9VIBR|nr:hypothetical protein [Vibrio lentus]MCC4840247.1 hypothetical protein [Vibrio lentus]PMI12443.1 hypothetical protein BCU51_24695 [Vibrio lentus]PMK32633.1 hypothetical protein BCU02_24520 [Vibrio lentus]PMK44955.1 hypothetical protein BCT99_04975 [Vibrio lentus]PML30010.1 hypothetical protein BCT79_23425 [Vibrio lentus]
MDIETRNGLRLKSVCVKVFIFIVGWIIVSTQASAQDRKTYTWFINKPSDATSSAPSLKSVNVDDILSDESYLSKSTTDLQHGLFVDGSIEPWLYRWARIEDRLDPDSVSDKVNQRYTAIVRPRATLDTIPDPIISSNRVRFDYWDYIDVLVFWGGNSQQGTVLAPDPQWIDEAHSNGVKIYGTVFLPSISHGGNFQDCQDLGTADLLKKLVNLADGLSFDGWFLNVESFEGEQQRQTCINQIETGLNESELRDVLQSKDVDFVKYIGSQAQDGWISDANIELNGFIEPKMKADNRNEVDYYLISEYGAEADLSNNRNPALFRSNKQYLMFTNASYWGQLDQTTKYTIKDGTKNNAEQVAKQYWEGMLGNDERKSSDVYNWNGVSQYTKKRLTDLQLESFPALGYEDMNFSGAMIDLGYGVTTVGQNTAVGEVSSIKVGAQSYARLCKSTGYLDCLTVWGSALDFVGAKMNDAINHLEVGPLELYPEKVAFYTDQYFQGQKLVLDQTNGFHDITDLNDGAFYRSISSLVVPPGKKIFLCNTRTEDSCHLPYSGTVTYVGDTNNDVARGIKIVDQPHPTLATIYANSSQQRPSFEVVQLDQIYNSSELGEVGSMSSSLKLHDQRYQLKACSQANLAGECDIYYADSDYFGDLKNDTYHSFIVEKRSLNNIIGLAYLDMQLQGPQYPLQVGVNENFPDVFNGGISSIKLLLHGYEFSYCLSNSEQMTECTDFKSTDSLGLSSAYNDNATLSIKIRRAVE